MRQSAIPGVRFERTGTNNANGDGKDKRGHC